MTTTPEFRILAHTTGCYGECGLYKFAYQLPDHIPNYECIHIGTLASCEEHLRLIHWQRAGRKRGWHKETPDLRRLWDVGIMPGW